MRNNNNNNNNNNKRPRGRQQPNKRPVNPKFQTFDSNGPDGRVRGNAQQVYEKYVSLAKDCTDDPVLAIIVFCKPRLTGKTSVVKSVATITARVRSEMIAMTVTIGATTARTVTSAARTRMGTTAATILSIRMMLRRRQIIRPMIPAPIRPIAMMLQLLLLLLPRTTTMVMLHR
jgi:hypothetical protein